MERIKTRQTIPETQRRTTMFPPVGREKMSNSIIQICCRYGIFLVEPTLSQSLLSQNCSLQNDRRYACFNRLASSYNVCLSVYTVWNCLFSSAILRSTAGMTPDYRKPAPNMAFQPPGGRPSASG